MATQFYGLTTCNINYIWWHGHAGIVAAVAPKVAQLVDGKGGGRAGRFQGRAAHVEKAAMASQILEDAMSTGSRE